LWDTKGTSKGSLDSLSYGCFHGGNELLGEGFDLSGDVWVGVGHEVSWVFSCPPWYGICTKWANRSSEVVGIKSPPAKKLSWLPISWSVSVSVGRAYAIVHYMRTIRRYSNRKLYDTTASHYLTLQDLGALIRQGEEVQVVVHSTGADITASTMAQIIFEEEKKTPQLPAQALRDIIVNGLK